MDSILEKIFINAERTPERMALVDKDCHMTYSAFVSSIKNAANVIVENGIRAGDCVLIQAVHKIEFAIAIFAVHYAGAVFVPIDKNVPADNLNSIIADTNAKLLVSDKAEECECSVISYSSLAKGGKMQFLLSLPKEEQLADLFFTTGTTGKPKGVLFNHRNLVAVVENLIGGSHMEDGTVYLVYGPLNHVFSVRKIYYTLFSGNTVVLLNGMVNIKLFYRMIENWHVTATHLLPAAAKVLFKLSKDKIGEYRDQLIFIESGTAPFSKDDMLKLRTLLPNTRLYFGYGCSESDCITKLEYSKYPDKVESVGRLTVHAEVKLLDENGEEIQADRNNPGLVACKGPMNMVGYWNDPELTSQVLVDGYIRTNDLAYFDDDGFLYILGRVGDVINVGGIKVSAKEIEELALRFEGVEDCAVIPVADPISTQTPKLFVVPASGYALEEKQLREYLAKTLETYKCPKYIEVIDLIPRTYNGKIQKNKLMEN